MAMVRNLSAFAQVSSTLSLVGAGFLGFGSATAAHAQATPRITRAVNESALVSVPGEVHPWARAQFDRGAAPENLSGHMLMVLKRSAAQETALRTFLASQQDPHSANYHKWLTPEDFGKRFGVADSDVQNVTGYLSAQGMRVGRVYGSRMAIEVEANAGQIHSAFGTQIHSYAVAGKTYYANNSNPKIPAALSGVVAGFASLNNFHAEGGSGAGAQATLNAATHTLTPLYTTGTTSNTYGVSPADLAVIYGIPAATGQGLGGQNVNVGIVGDSDINVQYITNYRTIFNLTPTTKVPIIVVDGNDPGVNGDAYIAYKQIELVSAVAPNANIYYYTSATTDYDSGIYFALIRAVEDNQVQVLLNGYQECESAIGSGAMELVNDVAKEAAALGMTFVSAAGNTGAAGCAVPGTSGSLANAAYAVNGYASSPYLTAVGGTDFYYGTDSMTSYWNTANGTNYLSVNTNTDATKPPVGKFKNGTFQEQVWNDSYSTSNAANGASVQMASGGGVSTAGLDGTSTPQPQPSYQSGKVNGISTTARVIPDVSFFAGSGANNAEGYNNTAYLFCMKSSDCLTSTTPQFTYSGGTEASSAVFAGAVALAVEQRNSGSRFGLGNVNPTLYSIFGSIVSHDITLGTNELACTSGANCTGGHMTGYAARSGYDAATGLGSFNISSFLTNYVASNTTASSVTLTITDNLTGKAPVCVSGGVTTPNCTTHSTMLKLAVSASSASGTGATPTGDVAIFTSSPLQSESAVETLTLSAGAATDTWNLLPGGTYNVYARYAGNTTYAPSVTSSPYTITVKPESCQMVVYGHNINVGSNTNIPYGTPISITVEPYSGANTNNVGIPSGSINVTDSNNLITTLPLNSEGATTFSSNLLTIGSHSLVLTYPGNASFNACSTGAFLATVGKAGTTTTLNPANADANSGIIYMTAVVRPTPVAVVPATNPATYYGSNGVAPAGTVTFNTNPAQTLTLVQGFDPSGNAIATASISVSKNNLNGGSLTATYNPAASANYTASSATSTVDSNTAFFQGNSTTTFTIADTDGVTNQSGPYPASDSLKLTIHVASPSADPSGNCGSFFGLFNLCSPVTVSVYADGMLLTNSLTVDSNGDTTFTLPQQNGYLSLPSGQVQINVIYSGYYFIISGLAQVGASSAVQTITISDDRTNADFSLQSDTTVNQAAPLVTANNVTKAIYNLRFTSLYNFQGAFPNTAINLSCAVTGYTSFAGVRSTPPTGLGCSFGASSVKLGTSGFATQTLTVGAASGYAIASNTVPAQPASRWWIATGGTTLACIFLLGLPARRRNWQSMLGAVVLVAVAFGITGCGANLAAGSAQQGQSNLNGGAPGTTTSQISSPTVPVGIYTVLVTASANANTTVTHTLPVQVIVGTPQ